MAIDMSALTGSPVEKVLFRGHEIHVKRDDLLGLRETETSAFNGNKARKLYYYLQNSWPDIDGIISCGSAQSNMLYSLSVLASLKGWSLDFYVDHVPGQLKKHPLGNYAGALSRGARIHSVSELKDSVVRRSPTEYVEQHLLPGLSGKLYIPEGGGHSCSEPGLQQLASEIKAWVQSNHIENPKLMLPSGTGTTALYLQKHLPFEVLTCACVGGQDYLRQQMLGLSLDTEHSPTILESPDIGAKKYHFGQLYPEFYLLWQEIREQTGITFELLYDPLGWLTMMRYLELATESVNMVYLHQGGLLGNQSMLPRYERKKR